MNWVPERRLWCLGCLEICTLGCTHYLYEILPISALIGAVLGLGTLASNSELIVMRSVGVSLWRIVGWVIRSALLLVVLSFALSEWVIPYTNEQAKAVKSYNKPVKIGEVKGYWTREGNRFIYIDYANAKGQLKMYRCWTLMIITVCGYSGCQAG